MENQVKTSTENKEQQLKKLSKMTMIRSLLPIAGLIIIFLMFNALTNFRMMNNLPLVLSQVYVTMISATGVFFIMTMGGLDFSQGSILGIASIVVCMVSKTSIPLAIVAGIAVGAAIGAINGYFYVYRKIKSFIVTICTMFLFRGFIKYLTTNAPVAGSAMLINFDSTELKLACTLVVLIIGFILFRFTKFGTYLKAIGAGEKAAMFSGIRTDRMKFLIYTLAGAITGFAAFINVIKVGSVTSSGGNQLETQILIALVLGGMPISGGAKVRFENIIVGSLLYIVLNSGLTMMGFTTQMMQLIRFRPDQPRNGSINRRQKILQTRLRQRASKHLRHFSINRFPECMAAPHDIFKETGLAFMHSHRSSLPHQRLCQVIPDAKFIDSMSRLMQHGKNRRINSFLIISPRM